MKKALLFVLFFFLTATKAFAGGGPLGLESFTLKPFDQTKAYIVAARIYADQCDGITVTAHFEDQSSGDSVNSFTPPDDGTYYEPHYFTGAPKNTWSKICMRYFQVKSSQEKLRTVVAEAVVDGSTVQASTQLAFGNDEYSKQVQQFDRYNNMPQVDVISEKNIGAQKTEITLQWNKIPNISSYVIFAKPTSELEGSALSSFKVEDATQTTITLETGKSYFIGVNTCDSNEDCTKEKPNTYELYVENLTGNTEQTTMQGSQQTIIAPSIIPTNQKDKKLAELNKKVAALEKKLEKSQKKQNVLEQKLNDLINFIKSIFPSFK